MRFTVFVSIGLSIILCACSKAPQTSPAKANSAINQNAKISTLRGTVFITTKGTEKVELGLVPILVFEKTSFAAYAETRSVPIAEARVARKTEIERLTALEAEKFAASKAAKLAALRLKVAGMQADDSYAESGDRKFDELSTQHKKGMESQLKRADKLTMEASHFTDQILDLVKTWPNENAEFYFTADDSAIATTKTDANGTFTFILPTSNQYVLCAKVQRPVAGTEDPEIYHWILDVGFEDGIEKELILSLENELTRSESESGVTLVKLQTQAEASHDL